MPLRSTGVPKIKILEPKKKSGKLKKTTSIKDMSPAILLYSWVISPFPGYISYRRCDLVVPLTPYMYSDAL